MSNPVPHAALRAELAKAGAEQKDIARWLNCHASAITKRMQGQIDWRLSELCTIATRLDVPISRLIDAETPAATPLADAGHSAVELVVGALLAVAAVVVTATVVVVTAEPLAIAAAALVALVVLGLALRAGRAAGPPRPRPHPPRHLAGPRPGRSLDNRLRTIPQEKP